MEGLRHQVAKQRRNLGVDEKKPLPEGQELVREFLENGQRLLVIKKYEEEKGGVEEK